MITSEKHNAEEAFVWVWLPHHIEPIVAGQIKKVNEIFSFRYGKSYLENQEAIPLSPMELPLQLGEVFPTGMNVIHSGLRDAAPDAWGRRIIDYQYTNIVPNELDYLLLSGSDRIGALDFQDSSITYHARISKEVALKDLLTMTDCVENAKPLPSELEYALLPGTSVGGARPKALIQDEASNYIAKFSLKADVFNVIKAEYVGMKLAKKVGLDVPEVSLQKVMNKDILLVKRFDRIQEPVGMTRRLMLSALTLLGLNELEARYASYYHLAELIRQQFARPEEMLLELYKRLVFNILIGNNDDHARNHSAFWDGKNLSLTPAYDLCPQPRSGQEATQAMALEGVEGNFSTLINVLSISEQFQISREEAYTLINNMIKSIEMHWNEICVEAKLTEYEINRLWKNAIFNPFCFRGWQQS